MLLQKEGVTMDMQKLKNPIYQGEKVDIECKRAESSVPKSTYESYSAFAYIKGGYIILGVKEDKTKTNPEENLCYRVKGFREAKRSKEKTSGTLSTVARLM